MRWKNTKIERKNCRKTDVGMKKARTSNIEIERNRKKGSVVSGMNKGVVEFDINTQLWF